MRLRVCSPSSLSALVALGLAVARPRPAPAAPPTATPTPTSACILVLRRRTARFRCTATLVSPTVLLTAAHCTDGIVGKTLVTFDSVIAEQPPAPFPVAADPAAGYTGRGDQPTPATSPAPRHRTRTTRTSPTWTTGTTSAWSSSTSRSPASRRPRSRRWDTSTRSRQPTCHKTLFTAVGYGTEVRKPDVRPAEAPADDATR